MFVQSLCTECQLYLSFSSPLIDIEDNADDANPNMLEVRDDNMRDAQQTDHTPAKVNKHSNKHYALRKHPTQCKEGSPQEIKTHVRHAKQDRARWAYLIVYAPLTRCPDFLCGM